MEERLLHKLRKEKDAYMAKTFELKKGGGHDEPRISLLAHSIRMNMVKVATYLLEQKRHVFDLNERFESGENAVRYTLLHHAVLRRMDTVVSLLVEKGADTLLENNDNHTPLALAKSLLEKMGQTHDRPKMTRIVELLERNTPTGYKRRRTQAAGSGSSDLADWSNLLVPDSPFSPSFTIEVKGGKELPCHKEILAKRSSYFNRLLGGNWKESTLDRVKFDDVTEVEMEWVLKSLYKHAALPLPQEPADPAAEAGDAAQASASSGSSSSGGGSASAQQKEPLPIRQPGEPLPLRLLLLSDRFGLDYVKDGLEDEISRCLTPGNVLGILMSSQKSGARQLESSCSDFILYNTNLHAALKAIEGPVDPAEAVALVESLRQGGPFRCMRVPNPPAPAQEAAPAPVAAPAAVAEAVGGAAAEEGQGGQPDQDNA